MRRSFSLGTFFGVEVRASGWWPVAFGVVAWLLGAHYFPAQLPGWAASTFISLAFSTAVLLFVSVGAHELSHALIARRLGLPVKHIELSRLGGTAELGRPADRPRDEFVIAAAGPLLSLVLALGFSLLAWAGPDAVGLPLVVVGHWLAMVNLALGLFNLLPGLPLDGGWLLHAVVWAHWRSAWRATLLAAAAGKLMAVGLLAWGLLLVFAGNWANGLGLVLISYLIDRPATQALLRAVIQQKLAGHTARDAMMTDCPRVGPAMNLSQLMSQMTVASRRRCFPVVGGGRVTGVITLDQVTRVPLRKWPVTTVGSIMVPLKQLGAVAPSTGLFDVMDQMARTGVDQIAVVEDGKLVGMVAWENVLAFVGAGVPLGAGRPPVG